MHLGDRKRRILQAIINDYIETAEPVGSRTISKRYMPDISSATIRNEMSDLEELGYLEQPHTSAGRIPSDLGYRLYVNSLMDRYRLSVMEMNRLQEAMDRKLAELDSLMGEASNILSHLTNYTAVAMAPEIKKSTIRSVQLLPVDERRLLVVIVTSRDTVKNRFIPLNKPIGSELTQKINNVLNKHLNGLALEDITLARITQIKAEVGYGNELINPVLDFIAEVINKTDSGSNIVLGGAANILNYPEYSSIEKARDILCFLDNHERIYEAINSSQTGLAGVNIIIGSENPQLQNHHCSIVLSHYKIGDSTGLIGLIGPTRMDYSKVVSVLDYFLGHFNKAIERLCGDIEEGGSG